MTLAGSLEAGRFSQGVVGFECVDFLPGEVKFEGFDGVEEVAWISRTDDRATTAGFRRTQAKATWAIGIPNVRRWFGRRR